MSEQMSEDERSALSSVGRPEVSALKEVGFVEEVAERQASWRRFAEQIREPQRLC